MNSPSFRLAECESVITTGIRAFYESGKALMEIREEGLYKETPYPTFEEYCQGKWKFTRQYASNLIQAYNVVKELEMSTIVDKKEHSEIILPVNETQARPLAKIKDSEERLKAWNKIVENSEQSQEPITAKKIEMVVSEYCAPCHADNCTFRVVSYLTPHYYKRFEALRRGEKEADYLRRVIEAHSEHPELLLPYMKQLTA